MSGEIIAQTMVSIHKKGSLEGIVTAKAITVEKGGMFSGELIIGQADLTQGELLAERKQTATNASEPEVSVGAPRPLPAT
jgi:cytoskeletal protein CcmA (bactofilin family)